MVRVVYCLFSLPPAHLELQLYMLVQLLHRSRVQKQLFFGLYLVRSEKELFAGGESVYGQLTT